MATYLDDILAHHRSRANADRRDWHERTAAIRSIGSSMLEVLRGDGNGHVKVIAEIKRRSPSKGWLNEGLNVITLAQEYVDGGATAISVLTDVEHFAGSLEDLTTVAAAVSVPLLRKDFTVSANDVLDAAEAGASAVLLIVAALSDDELESFIGLAHEIGMDALIEIHDHDEAKRSLDCGARIIGINQRDLRTFEVDRDNAERVIASLPSSIVSVCESGLRSAEDVARAGDLGFSAVLVGEAFLTATDVAKSVRAFANVPRRARV